MYQGKTKYSVIEDWIRDQIRDGHLQPGDRLPSESALCTRFGVSRNSVRHALLSLSQDGSVETVKGVGTFCRARTEGQTTNIGFVCFFSHAYIFPSIVQGCDSVLYREGYHLLLAQSEYRLSRERDVLHNLRRKGVDGIIVEPINSGNGENNLDLFRELDSSGVPVVFIDNYFPNEDFSSVALDDRAAGRLAAEHLIAGGYTSVGLFYEDDYLPKLERIAGAVERFGEAGITVPERWHVRFQGQGALSGAADAAKAFFAHVGSDVLAPAAFICTNDEEALHLIEAAEASGRRYPQDIAIVGFDNSDIAAVDRIGLTSIDHPSHYIGNLASRLILDAIRDGSNRRRSATRINPQLIVRKSAPALHSKELK